MHHTELGYFYLESLLDNFDPTNRSPDALLQANKLPPIVRVGAKFTMGTATHTIIYASACEQLVCTINNIGFSSKVLLFD